MSILRVTYEQSGVSLGSMAALFNGQHIRHSINADWLYMDFAFMEQQLMKVYVSQN